MYQKVALAILIAAATCSDASAHWFGHHHHYHGYAAPAYAAPVAYYPAPVFPVPAYVTPAYYAPVPVVQPVYGYVPSVTTIRHRSTPHRSVLRVRSW